MFGRCAVAGITSSCPVFVAHLALADGHQGDLSFNNQSLLSFLSPAADSGDDTQRVLGDYQQMVAIGNKFYGVFTGNSMVAAAIRTVFAHETAQAAAEAWRHIADQLRPRFPKTRRSHGSSHHASRRRHPARTK
jgi:hypothetical protein